MKKAILSAAIAGAVACSSLVANELKDLSATATIAFESEYVFRGGKQYEEAIQPGLDLSLPVFEGEGYIGYWGSYSIDNGEKAGDTNFSESDFFLGYAQNLTEEVSIDGGYTFYGFPDTAGGSDRWHEVYLGLSGDYMELSPALYAYYNFSHDAWTIESSVGHSFDLSDTHDGLSLDLGGYLGYVAMDDVNGDQVAGETSDGYTYWGGSADLVYTMNDVASFSLGVRYAGNNNDSDKTTAQAAYLVEDHDALFWWGASASFGF